ncbi:MAG: hypothetical protein CMJ83_13335 [Planctomycetes bacterium]|nr:hypothetical protein [Planctomycetota bacterium]
MIDPRSPIERFRARFADDVEAGTIAPLATYLQAFPDADVEIATAWIGYVAESDLGAGGHVGPYRLVRQIGRGGMGVVFEAEGPGSRRVAVKLVERRRDASLNAQRRFAREARIASQLEHPGICRVYQTDLDGPVPYIAMELVPGRTLKEHLAATAGSATTVILTLTSDGEPTRSEPAIDTITRAERALPGSADVVAFVWMMVAAARALHHAHENGIIHRDVKPGNIMVRPDGKPVVLDFGLARRLDDDDDAALTQSGDVLGTPRYMSPEQVRADLEQIDGRTDVYSLGITLHEGLTLRPPYGSPPTHAALRRAILEDELPDLDRVNPAISRDLAVVVQTACAKELDRRYESAANLADDLQRVLDRQPVSARPLRSWGRLALWARRRPAVAASLGLAVAALVVGLVVSLLFYFDAVSESERAIRSNQSAQQMLDAHEARELLGREQRLWPVSTAMVEPMSGWLVDARQLLSRRALHHARFGELDPASTPMSDRERSLEQRRREERYADVFQERAQAQRKIETLEIRLQRAEPEEREERERAVEVAQRRLEELQRHRAFEAHLFWGYGQREKNLAIVLQSLIYDLEKLETLVPDVERRLREARLAGEALVEKHRKAWDACFTELEVDARFTTIARVPQTGLVPLGADPISKLQEFWHVASGERPVRGADGNLILTPETSIVLVLVPAGEFRRGTGFSLSTAVKFSEGPRGKERLPPFLISKYEVTQGQWFRTMGDWPSVMGLGFSTSPGRKVNAIHPVETVTWFRCEEAVRRWGLELPTEMQWECAVRAGTRTDFHDGDDKQSLSGRVNLRDRFADAVLGKFGRYEKLGEQWGGHAPANSLRPNAWGLFHLHGNVKEWCRDRYHPKAYLEIPPRPEDGLREAPWSEYRAYRGGSYMTLAQDARCSTRRHLLPRQSGMDLGFRTVRRWRRPD